MDFTDKCRKCGYFKLREDGTKYCIFDNAVVLGDVIHCKNFKPIKVKA